MIVIRSPQIQKNSIYISLMVFQVFTAECMRQYLMLFNALWKDKRMEMILADIWKEQAATSKLCRDLPGQFCVASELRGCM